MTGAGAGVPAPRPDDWLFRILWLLVAVATSFIGVVYQRNNIDSFRIVKLALYEAEAIVCLALILILLLWRKQEVFALLRPHRLPMAIVAAAVLWTGITSLTSSNRTLSVPAMIWVASCAVVFTATLLVARLGRGSAIAILPLIAATINALFAIAQRAGWSGPATFNPLTPDRYRISAIIGNPNDLGVYLFLCAVPALALAVAARGRRQIFNALAALFVIALLVTQTASALIAFSAAMLIMIVLLTRRVRVAAAVLAAAALVVIAIAPLRNRALSIAGDVRRGSLMAATSYRLPAYAVAWRIFLDHPLVGSGPGTYGWWYLSEKMRLDHVHPEFELTAENFGEAHNDHLQTLAVSGIPGYLIFAGALITLGALSFRRTDDDLRSRFAHAVALPLAGGFAVVTLAQFPLELASTASIAIHFAALGCAWAGER